MRKTDRFSAISADIAYSIALLILNGRGSYLDAFAA